MFLRKKSLCAFFMMVLFIFTICPLSQAQKVRATADEERETMKVTLSGEVEGHFFFREGELGGGREGDLDKPISDKLTHEGELLETKKKLTIKIQEMRQKGRLLETLGLSTAEQAGLIEMALRGQNRASGHIFDAEIKNKTGEQLSLRIPGGSFLNPSDPSHQRMMTTQETRISLGPGKEETFPINGFCVDHGKFPPPTDEEAPEGLGWSTSRITETLRTYDRYGRVEQEITKISTLNEFNQQMSQNFTSIETLNRTYNEMGQVVSEIRKEYVTDYDIAKDLNDFNQQINQNITSIETLNRTYNQMNQVVSEIRKEYVADRTKITQLGEINQLINQDRIYTEKLSKFTKETQQNIQSIEQTILDEKKISTLGELNQQINQSFTQIETLNRTYNEMGQVMSEIREQYVVKKDKVEAFDELNQYINENRTTIETLERTYNEMGQVLSEIRNEYVDYQEKITKLTTLNTNIEKEKTYTNALHDTYELMQQKMEKIDSQTTTVEQIKTFKEYLTSLEEGRIITENINSFHERMQQNLQYFEKETFSEKIKTATQLLNQAMNEARTSSMTAYERMEQMAEEAVHLRGRIFSNLINENQYNREFTKISELSRLVERLNADGTLVPSGLSQEKDKLTITQWTIWNIIENFNREDGKLKIEKQVLEAGGEQTPEQITQLNENIWNNVDLVKKNLRSEGAQRGS